MQQGCPICSGQVEREDSVAGGVACSGPGRPAIWGQSGKDHLQLSWAAFLVFLFLSGLNESVWSLGTSLG
jgi:hypothetical protein